jgi:hypothetical protein
MVHNMAYEPPCTSLDTLGSLYCILPIYHLLIWIKVECAKNVTNMLY